MALSKRLSQVLEIILTDGRATKNLGPGIGLTEGSFKSYCSAIYKSTGRDRHALMAEEILRLRGVVTAREEEIRALRELIEAPSTKAAGA